MTLSRLCLSSVSMAVIMKNGDGDGGYLPTSPLSSMLTNIEY